MDRKWIILIIMVIVFNLVGILFLSDVSWSGTFTIVANAVLLGWVLFAPTSKKGKKIKK
ncbi:MAG: hypothetical protein FWG67_02935 [Defluviitaleaceae bacterium]|nr:hypothetical protein [Defluviitaleaceae bacterium]